MQFSKHPVTRHHMAVSEEVLSHPAHCFPSKSCFSSFSNTLIPWGFWHPPSTDSWTPQQSFWVCKWEWAQNMHSWRVARWQRCYHCQAHTKERCPNAFHSPSSFQVLGDKERDFFTAPCKPFQTPWPHTGKHPLLWARKGKKCYLFPYQVLIAARMPEAMQALTGNLGFTRLLLKGLELTQQGTPICQQQHLFLCSQMVSSPEENSGDMWEGKKKCQVYSYSLGLSPKSNWKEN